MTDETALIGVEQIEQAILLLRGQKVILDRDLAAMYGVETKQLKRAVKRNHDRFPPDFMFELTEQEAVSSRCQFGTLKRGQNIKYLPYAFTEQGVAMLSSVLQSPRAVQVNIAIMRAFVRLRETLSLHKELAHKLTELEQRIAYLKNLDIHEAGRRKVEGVLLYPTVSQSLELEYVVQGHKLRVLTLDLNVEWRQIRQRLLGILG